MAKTKTARANTATSGTAAASEPKAPIRKPKRAAPIRLGVIGGSGLYKMAGLANTRSLKVTTPFGAPSDRIVVGEVNDVGVAFLPRHGVGHRLLPSEVPYRANVFALKELGCEVLLSVSAVGSLRQEIRPGDVVIPDQFIDLTKGRASSFFGAGCVAHVSFADPICAPFAALVAEIVTEDAAKEGKASSVHRRGTYVCMEGPQFSTRAESTLYRQWKAEVIGMTNATEAKLAREAEMPFATMAIATDYDCWNAEAGDVDVAEILRILSDNAERTRRVVQTLAERLPESVANWPGADALAGAILTEAKAIPIKTRRSLAPIIGKYIKV